jgi:hypothetical protein
MMTLKSPATHPESEIVDHVPPGQLAQTGVASAVPILDVAWFDARQTCRLVHDYLEGKTQGVVPDYGACPAYAGGTCCGASAAGLSCLFHLPDSSAIWHFARQWHRITLADGTSALARDPEIGRPEPCETQAPCAPADG